MAIGWATESCKKIQLRYLFIPEHNLKNICKMIRIVLLSWHEIDLPFSKFCRSLLSCSSSRRIDNDLRHVHRIVTTYEILKSILRGAKEDEEKHTLRRRCSFGIPETIPISPGLISTRAWEERDLHCMNKDEVTLRNWGEVWVVLVVFRRNTIYWAMHSQ